MPRLTQSEAIKAFAYDPNTGVMTNQKKRGKRNPGVDKDGYLRFSWMREVHRVHRIAWLITYGEWPNGQIDHINGDRQDNRISNLRVANYYQQGQNQVLRGNNASGLPGVTLLKNGKWYAQINVNGKKKSLGRFPDAQSGHLAYLKAKEKYHTFSPKPRYSAAIDAAIASGGEDRKA